MNEHLAAIDRIAADLAEPVMDPRLRPAPRDLEAELAAAIAQDAPASDDAYADAIQAVARQLSRSGLDPTAWTPSAARAALDIVGILKGAAP